MQRLLRPYLTFLRLPDVAGTLVIAFLARMPTGMMALSMVMFMRQELGNFRVAGTVIGAYFVAMAVAAPVQGRLIDRIGPRWPLLITGVVELAAFALFIAAVTRHWPMPVLFAIAVALGMFSPPITVLTRTLWRHRFSTDEERRMAFSIDAVLMELNFTAGPGLVGLLLVWQSPQFVCLLVWGVLAFAITIFFRSPALKYWKHEPEAERHPLGPLTEPRLWLLFAIVFCLTFACGLIEVGYPAYATALAVPAFAGAILSLNALGSAVGGFAFGVSRLPYALPRQLALLIAIFAVGMLLHLPVEGQLAFAIVAFVSGCAISPAFATQTLLVSRLAPDKYATEAFTWAATFIVCGLGAGMAAAGALSEGWHVKAPFAMGTAVLALAAGMACLLRERG